MTGPGRDADKRERQLHARYRLLAAAAVDGRIDAEDAADLEAHHLTCGACRAELAAMQADHRLLAEPARVPPPSPRVRVAILEAAAAPRVPDLGARPRPWTAVLAASLVVFVGAGLLLATLRPLVPGGAPTESPGMTATATAPVTPLIPVGIASGHFAAVAPGGGALDVDVQLLGRVEAGGSATVVVAGPFGESWTGRVTRSLFWADRGDPRGLVWVAYLEGCKTDTSCEAFQMMLVDARDTDRRHRIALDFYPSLGEIDSGGPYTSYGLTSGSVSVTGPIEAIP